MSSDPLSRLFNRAAAHAVKFRNSITEAPTLAVQDYDACLQHFDQPLPEQGAPAEAVIDELAAKAADGLGMPVSPRFFGWVMGASHPAGVAADFLTGAWGQIGSHPANAPAASAIEYVTEKWLLELLDLPRQSSIGFVSGATVANFTALAAARGEVLRRVGWDADGQGLFGAPPITVLIGADAHSTVFMALQYLGLGHDRVVKVATDSQGRVLQKDFAAKIAKVTGPAIVILQAGQINTGDFDPFSAIIPAAHRAGAWVHVDGAFGLWARATPTLRHLTAGIEEADSWATDGHKWLQVPYDCGFVICRDELAHRRAMTVAASYLPTPEAGLRVPYNYVPELSKRAKANGTWAVIKCLGRAGIVEMVERHCAVARAMAARLAAEPGVTVENDVVLNQVIVRFGAGEEPRRGDELTKATIARIQSDRVCYAGGADWRGREIMRISVCSKDTTVTDGLRSTEAMIAAFRNVRQQG